MLTTIYLNKVSRRHLNFCHARGRQRLLLDYLLRILANSFIRFFFFEKQFFSELRSFLSRTYSAILKEEHRKMPETSNNSRHVELSWAGLVIDSPLIT